MKTMKKVSSLFLALLMIAGMCSVPAMAAETGCLNVLSDTVYTFDGENIGDYGVVSNSEVNNTTSAETDATTYAGNRAEIVAETEGSSNKVLKLTQANGSHGVQIKTWDGNDTGDFHIAFDIKKSGGDSGYFNLTGYKGSRWVHMLMMYGKTIYLNNTAVYTYELDTWYHLDLQLNMAKHYARLSITKRGESEPTVIDLPYGVTYNAEDQKDRTVLDYFYIGWRGGKTTGGSVMIDNYMQDDITDNPVTPSMDSHDDSFDSLPPINKNTNGRWNQTGVATRTGWTFVKADVGNAVTTSIEDGKLKLSTADSGKFSEIAKQPFYSAPNVRHRISLKMNGYDRAVSGENTRSVMIRFANTDGTLNTADGQDGKYLLTDFINFKYDSGDYLVFFGMGGATERIPLVSDPDFMYPIEFVYDAAAKLCVATVTDQNGVQHEADLSEKIQNHFTNTLKTADGVWYNLGAVGIRFPSGTLGNAVCYLDDFNWDIFNDTALTATSAVKYTGNDGSPLDETVTFDFDRPVKSTATVAITSNGEAVTTPYTTSVESGILSVKFSDLDLNTPYTVTVSGVTPMESDVTQAETTYTKEFTTANAEKAISATTPALDGTSISSTVTSYYAEGRPAMLIAALYKNDKLVKVITEPLDKADSRSGEVVSLDISGYDYDEIRSFVWSGFAQLLPYSEALK